MRQGLLLAALLCGQAAAADQRAPVAPRAAVVSPLTPQAAALSDAPSAAASAATAVADRAVEQAAAPLADLAPERAQDINGEQASELAGRLIEPKNVSGGAAAADAVEAPAPQASFSRLAAPGGERGGPTPPAVRPPSSPAPEQRVSLRQRLHEDLLYGRLWWQNLGFFLVTNIVNKWGAYEKEWRELKASGVTPPVSNPRGFFAWMRVMALQGRFRPAGFVTRKDKDVMYEARQTFERYFDGVGREELRAFDQFLERAHHYNESHRNYSYFRKIVRDTMLKISVMPPGKIAPYLDSAYARSADESAAKFQRDEAPAILERFRQTALAQIRAEPEGVKGRVIGVILIGSFATGGATPSSDFDIEPVTEDGTSARIVEFTKALTERWKAEGLEQKHPLTYHMFAYTRSRRLTQMIHDTPYIVISPDETLLRDIGMRPEQPLVPPSPELDWKSGLQRGLHYAAVYATSLVTPRRK